MQGPVLLAMLLVELGDLQVVSLMVDAKRCCGRGIYRILSQLNHAVAVEVVEDVHAEAIRDRVPLSDAVVTEQLPRLPHRDPLPFGMLCGRLGPHLGARRLLRGRLDFILFGFIVVLVVTFTIPMRSIETLYARETYVGNPIFISLGVDLRYTLRVSTSRALHAKPRSSTGRSKADGMFGIQHQTYLSIWIGLCICLLLLLRALLGLVTLLLLSIACGLYVRVRFLQSTLLGRHCGLFPRVGSNKISQMIRTTTISIRKRSSLLFRSTTAPTSQARNSRASEHGPVIGVNYPPSNVNLKTTPGSTRCRNHAPKIPWSGSTAR